jgi:hypothetical protein
MFEKIIKSQLEKHISMYQKSFYLENMYTLSLALTNSLTLSLSASLFTPISNEILFLILQILKTFKKVSIVVYFFLKHQKCERRKPSEGVSKRERERATVPFAS